MPVQQYLYATITINTIISTFKQPAAVTTAAATGTRYNTPVLVLLILHNYSNSSNDASLCTNTAVLIVTQSEVLQTVAMCVCVFAFFTFYRYPSTSSTSSSSVSADS